MNTNEPDFTAAAAAGIGGGSLGKQKNMMATNDDNAVLIDVAKVAAMSGLHRATIFKLVSCGKFPRPVKLGRATRWVKGELVAWFAAKCPPLAKWEAMRTDAVQKKQAAALIIACCGL